MRTPDREHLEREAERLGLLGGESLDDALLEQVVHAYQVIEAAQSEASNDPAPSAIPEGS